MNFLFRVSVLCVAAAIALGIQPQLSQAAVEVKLGGPDLTNTPPSATVPNDAIILSFANTLISDTVQLSIDVTGTSTKISKILFNVDPDITGLSFKYVSGPQPDNLPDAPDTTTDPFAANSFGMGGPLTGFDVELLFGTSGPDGDLWNGSALAILDITKTAGTASLTEDSFSFTNSNSHFGAVHVNKPNGASPSGKYGTPPDVPTYPGGGVDPVPEPLSLLIWSGLFSVVGMTATRQRNS